jgi:DNA replication protein DnaC
MMIPAARPAQAIDAARLPVMLTMLRLPTIGRLWEGFAVQADKEGWGAARFLAALCEHEIADRDQRRIARHLNESGLPAGKTFATFDFAAVPTLRKAHVLALADSDTWLDQGANILCFGPSGVGKSHAAAAIGYALIEHGKRVLFVRTTDMVQRLQAARRDLVLPAALAKLDKFDAVVLDDLGYARKDQAETAVLFELIAERYERRARTVLPTKRTALLTFCVLCDAAPFCCVAVAFCVTAALLGRFLPKLGPLCTRRRPFFHKLKRGARSAGCLNL